MPHSWCPPVSDVRPAPVPHVKRQSLSHSEASSLHPAVPVASSIALPGIQTLPSSCFRRDLKPDNLLVERDAWGRRVALVNDLGTGTVLPHGQKNTPWR